MNANMCQALFDKIAWLIVITFGTSTMISTKKHNHWWLRAPERGGGLATQKISRPTL